MGNYILMALGISALVVGCVYSIVISKTKWLRNNWLENMPASLPYVLVVLGFAFTVIGYFMN